MDVSFSFDYTYWEDGLFAHKGSGSFKGHATFWHYIDKFNTFNGNIYHIVTFQVIWADTLDQFKITDSTYTDVI